MGSIVLANKVCHLIIDYSWILKICVQVSMYCMCCGLNVAKCNLGKVKIEPMLVANASCGLSF